MYSIAALYLLLELFIDIGLYLVSNCALSFPIKCHNLMLT